MSMQKKYQSGNTVAIAVIVAGLLIGAAIMFSSKGSDNVANVAGTGSTNNHGAAVQPSGDFRLPDASDHTRGNPDAKVAIVEFSDLECPFCARLHPTVQRVVDENEDVKWVYRHFPLSIHSNAFGAAVASECIAKLGGNDAFWDFTDSAFSNQRSLDDKFYLDFAVQNEISESQFNSCLEDQEIADAVRADLNEVTANGGRGTPFSVIVTAEGQLVPFSGALPYEQIIQLVEQALVS
jgi:protein-disulfide isomerase